MRNFRTSRSNLKYHYDINVESKKWEVIELPTRKIIREYDFEDDAKVVAKWMTEHKPFGDHGFPSFLTHK